MYKGSHKRTHLCTLQIRITYVQNHMVIFIMRFLEVGYLISDNG